MGPIAALAIILLFAVPVIALLAVLLFRRKGRMDYPTCGRCQYDVSGSVGKVDRCPECGVPFVEGGIVPPRRRATGLPMAAVALILLITCAGGALLLTGITAQRAAVSQQRAMISRQQATVQQQLVQTQLQQLIQADGTGSSTVVDVISLIRARLQDNGLDPAVRERLRTILATMESAERDGGGERDAQQVIGPVR